MSAAGEDGQRWTDAPGGPGAFEWRLHQVERRGDDHDLRIRTLETGMSVFSQKLDQIIDATKRTDERTEQQQRDRYRNLWGFILSTAVVVVSVVLSHLYIK